MTTMTRTLSRLDLYNMTSLILSSPTARRRMKGQLRDFRVVSGKELEAVSNMTIDRYTARLTINFRAGVPIEKVFEEDECPLPENFLAPWENEDFVMGLFASTIAKVFEWQTFDVQDLDGNFLYNASPWEACRAWCNEDGLLHGHYVCASL